MRLRSSYVITISMLSLLLEGCGASSSGGSSTSNESKVALSVPSELSISNGLTDVISVTEQANSALSLTAKPEATNIKLYFNNQSEENNFNISYSQACTSLNQSTTCQILLTPKANSSISLNGIDATVSGDNTDSYPIKLDQKMLAVKTSNNIISAGDSADITITNNLNTTVYNFKPIITGNNISYQSTCSDSLSVNGGCQINVTAANSAQNENLQLMINGVNYTNQLGGLSVVRPELMLSSNTTTPGVNIIKPNGKLTLTLSNNTDAKAQGIDINAKNINQLIPGMTLTNTTCSSNLDANNQCVINLQADKSIKPATTNLVIPAGTNFNQVSTEIIAENIQSSLSLSKAQINASSNTVSEVAVNVTNKTANTLSNLYWSVIPENLKGFTENKTKTTCQSTLDANASCQFVLDYNPGNVSEYNEILSRIEVDATNGFSSQNKLLIRNFPAFYTTPIDFEKYSNKLAYNNISSIAALDNGNTLYATTFGGGLLISHSEGELWRNVSTINGIGSNNISAILPYNNTLYAATTNGLSISSDDGKTWNNVLQHPGQVKFNVDSIATDGSKLYLGTMSAGLYISDTMKGDYFTQYLANDGLPSNYIYSVVVKNNVIYLGTAGKGLAVSSDQGKTWQNYTTQNGLINDSITNLFITETGNQPTIYAATKGGLSISSDGGKFWHNVTTQNGISSDYIHAVAVSGNNIYLATAAGLSISSDNGQTWTNETMANGLPANNINNITIEGDVIYITSYHNGYAYSTDGGKTWIKANYMLNNMKISKAYTTYQNNGVLYVGTQYGLSISDDNGMNWTNITSYNGLAKGMVTSISSDNTNLYVTTSSGLSVSSDNGKTWQNYLSDKDLLDAVIDGNNWYVASSDGVEVSNDAGASWTLETNGLNSNVINSIYLDKTTNTLYVGESNGFAKSTDGGKTWQPYTDIAEIGSSFNDDSINDVYVDGNNMYTAGDLGLIVSHDGGKTWANYLSKKQNVPYIYSINVENNMIYAATANGGYVLDANNGNILKQYTTANGLSDNYVHGIDVNNGEIYAATWGGGLSMKALDINNQ